jgi:uncharacterized damage-inducible protein DinB
MAFADTFIPEFDHEMATTRALLERVPFDNAAWKPHAKSTGLGSLASHIANLAGFGEMIVTTEERDFAPANGQRVQPAVFTSTQELLAAFDANVQKSRAAIQGLADDKLGVAWTLRAGDHVVFTLPRAAVLRSMLMNHIIHHRGQLSVYLRLNDVPLPSIYGPTADT